MAATLAKRPFIYNMFKTKNMDNLHHLIKAIQQKTVGQVFTYIERYSKSDQGRFLFDDIIQ